MVEAPCCNSASRGTSSILRPFPFLRGSSADRHGLDLGLFVERRARRSRRRRGGAGGCLAGCKQPPPHLDTAHRPASLSLDGPLDRDHPPAMADPDILGTANRVPGVYFGWGRVGIMSRAVRSGAGGRFTRKPARRARTFAIEGHPRLSSERSS